MRDPLTAGSRTPPRIVWRIRPHDWSFVDHEHVGRHTITMPYAMAQFRISIAKAHGVSTMPKPHWRGHWRGA